MTQLDAMPETGSLENVLGQLRASLVAMREAFVELDIAQVESATAEQQHLCGVLRRALGERARPLAQDELLRLEEVAAETRAQQSMVRRGLTVNQVLLALHSPQPVAYSFGESARR